MAEIAALLLIAAALTTLTRPGRRIAGKAFRRAYKATGWRTPRAAARHHGRRLRKAAGRGLRASARSAGHAAGRTVRQAGRAAGRLAAAAGRRVEAGAARRWQARRASTTPVPLLWRHREPGAGDGAGQHPAGGPPPMTGMTCPECGERAVRRPPADLTPYAAHGMTRPEWSHADGSPLCPVMTPGGYRPASPAGGGTGRPASTSGQPDPAGDPGTGSMPGPDQPSSSATTTAPRGAERSTRPMTSRYSINLDQPTTDGEFLESCVQLGDVLRSLAEQVADWAGSLSALNLPRSVLSPLEAVAEGIEEAASGATRAAASFEDEFEDARDVASRGMTITGQDAA